MGLRPLYKMGRDFEMTKQKKLNKKKLIVVVLIIIFILSIPVFGRYIYHSIREAYLLSKQFYFTSDVLTTTGSNYTYTEWGGLDEYAIEFNLYSYNNELAKLDYDLEYTVTCEVITTDKITAVIDDGLTGSSTLNGIIYGVPPTGTNESSVRILVNPIVELNRGDIVKLRVTAKTEEPYKKQISCTYTLEVAQETLNTFTIEDVENRDYAILKLINKYETATPVVLEFDPNELRLDLNDEIYRDNTNVETTTISGEGTFINKIEFTLEAEAAKYVKFYKVDKAQNYSYTGVEATSTITVTY